MSDYYGCGDSLCMFGRPEGMMTNGGCRCLQSMPRHLEHSQGDRRRIERGVRQLRSEVDQLKELIGPTLDKVEAMVAERVVDLHQEVERMRPVVEAAIVAEKDGIDGHLSDTEAGRELIVAVVNYLEGARQEEQDSG